MKASFVNELERTLTGDSSAAPPSHILEGIGDELAHREFAHVPRTIYAELWHIAFWQQISLDWVRGIATLNPASVRRVHLVNAQTQQRRPEGLRCYFAEL